MRFCHLVGAILIAALCAEIHAAQSIRITRAYADGSGASHIALANGQDIAVPKEKGQIGAADIKITSDHQTVGWFVAYPNPDADRAWEKLYSKLVLWRDGKVIRRFSTEQVFWSWDFWQDGRQVRFHAGPLHGAGRFELHDLETGRLITAIDERAPRPCLTGRSRWAINLSVR
jgi:hypothetical protein